MKKLVKLEIENFQAHAHTVIDFSDGVTVLCGESNNGKTAVLRALSWLMTNRPSGIGFVSHWAKTTDSKGARVLAPSKKCSVKLSILGDDDKVHVIERLRSATENKYIVDDVELSAIGADVPDSVSALLRMKAVNRQSQDDGYFFLTQTAGQMASNLNELVHLDTIDEAYGYAHRRKVEANVLYKEAMIAQTEAQHMLNGLKHIPEMRGLYNEAEKCCTALKAMLTALEETNILLDKLTEVYSALDRAVPSVDKQILRMKALGEDIAAAKEEQYSIETLLQKLERADEALAELPSVSKKKLEELPELVCAWRAAIDSSSAVNGLCEDISALEDALARCAEELSGLEKELPKTCPLCGARIGDCAHDRSAETAS